MGDRGLWIKAPMLYYSSCRESLRSVFRRCYPRENEEDVRNIRIRGNDDVTSMVLKSPASLLLDLKLDITEQFIAPIIMCFVLDRRYIR